MITLGVERLVVSSALSGLRVGVVCNPASVDSSFRHIVDRVVARTDVTLAAIFGPQHGFRADVQDNMIETPHARDATRRAPVYSLYSDTREPTAEMLEGLDALVIDLQDIGARIYTYAHTMANCLRAAAKHGVKVIVCDRPNPIGGEEVEGPMLVPGFESFVGQFAIPMRHGMTIGELAYLFNKHFGIGAALDVWPLEGWRRSMYHDETKLPWVMPSPNIPTFDSTVVFPGAVLFEGTNISEGRGTTRPFELFGAPWIVAEPFADGLNALQLPGVHFRPVVFEPTFQKHARTPCGGCQIHVTDRRVFRPVLTGVAAIVEMARGGGGQFAWRDPPYEYEHEKRPIDVLAGSDALRRSVDAGLDARAIADTWLDAADEFIGVRRKYLLYS